MQIDDERIEEKTGSFVRWGGLIFFVALCVLVIFAALQFYRVSAPITEVPVADNLQPTMWKGEYILPIPPVSANVLSDKDVQPVARISVALVLSHRSDVKDAQNALPLVKESILLLMRGLSVQDIQSPEALYRLKQALLRRMQWVLDPIVVQDVLISELFLDSGWGES